MVGRAVMPRSRKPSEPPGFVGAIPTPSANSLTLNERKSHEVYHPLPKPIAPSPELQTKSCYSNSSGHKVEPGVPSLACRSKTQNVPGLSQISEGRSARAPLDLLSRP